MVFRKNDSFTKEQARKGGHANKKPFFKENPDQAREAGRKGGLAYNRRDKKGRFIKKTV